MKNPKHQPYPTNQSRRWVYSDPEIDFHWSHLTRATPFFVFLVLFAVLFINGPLKGDWIANYGWGSIGGFLFFAFIFLAATSPDLIYALRFHRVEIDRDANTCKVRAGFLGLQHRNTFALSDFVRVRTHHTTYARYRYVRRSKDSGYRYTSDAVTPVALETRDGVLVDLLCFGSNNRKHAEVIASLLNLPMRSAGADRNRPISQLDESLITRLSRLPAAPPLPPPPLFAPSPSAAGDTTLWTFPAGRYLVDIGTIIFGTVSGLLMALGVTLAAFGIENGMAPFAFGAIFGCITWAIWFFSKTRGAVIQLNRQTLQYRSGDKNPWRSIPIDSVEELLLSPSRGKWRVNATSDTASISLSPPLSEDAARWLRQSIEFTLWKRSQTP